MEIILKIAAIILIIMNATIIIMILINIKKLMDKGE